MAHSCPDCGQVCFCGGDIDDCTNDFEEDVLNCTHCEDELDDEVLGDEEDDPQNHCAHEMQDNGEYLVCRICGFVSDAPEQEVKS